ncbi:hypothetical protein B1756_03050 [Natrarchaeobaculum aegyptiacum]|uniref:Uncharacterized protein n=2 Tax=Natrarchaeobaculum aegyptiacum TaxID=745377 RepID=A0A2Z2HWL7_9EURY|nr:hypothetical protein B1756_03050 [Natrarchaeobaculum aegyptiacum]
MEDVEIASQQHMVHLWLAIISAVVSLLLPFVGIVAAYSGYRLMTVMHRRWFGLVFAGIGLASFSLSMLTIALLQLGYIGG